MDSTFATIVTTQEPTKVENAPGGRSGALVLTYRNGVRALVKPVKDKMPNGKSLQRGIPVRTHPYREVAFYKLAELFGFEALVPETVLFTYKGVEASAQLYVPAQTLKETHADLKKLTTHDDGWSDAVIEATRIIPRRFWRQLLILDLVAGSRDRHANNIGVILRIIADQSVYRLIAWDNAVTFGLTFEKYHNVFHKLLFHVRADLEEVWPAIDGVTLVDFQDTFAGLLSSTEIEHAYRRLTFIRDDFSYRIPWAVCSPAGDGWNDFPSYDRYFVDGEHTPLEVP